jgi:hypothetical protein
MAWNRNDDHEHLHHWHIYWERIETRTIRNLSIPAKGIYACNENAGMQGKMVWGCQHCQYRRKQEKVKTNIVWDRWHQRIPVSGIIEKEFVVHIIRQWVYKSDEYIIQMSTSAMSNVCHLTPSLIVQMILPSDKGGTTSFAGWCKPWIRKKWFHQQN